jgi:hypothetical protein
MNPMPANNAHATPSSSAKRAVFMGSRLSTEQEQSNAYDS